MKNLKTIALVFTWLFFISCGSTKISSDYDTNADFSNYKTFAFSQTTKDLPVNELVKDRILNAITNNLKSKGFSESDNPDMSIELGVQTRDKTDYQTTSYGMNGYYGRRWRIGTGISTASSREINYTEGTLVINLVDNKRDKLLWMASATDVVDNNATSQENITKIVNQMMSSFPPEK